MSYKRRQVELLLGESVFIAPATDLRQFKIVFDILIDFGGAVSYCDCRVYNLSDATRADVLTTGESFAIRAGYEDTIDYLFRGTISNVIKERDGPSTVTRIICRGGAQPPSTVEQTVGVNAQLIELIRSCASAMGYPLVINADDFTGITYARGYVLNGDPRVYLDNLAETHGFRYVIENESIIVIKDGQPRDTAEPFVISEKTGMEGYPEITEVGVDVKVRLQPKIRIGGQVDIQSELRTFNFSNLYYQNIPASAGVGIYNVYKLQHQGDTWGDDWTTTVTGYRTGLGIDA